MKPDPQQLEARLRLGASGQELELKPGYPSSKLDELLAQRGAETWVFLPLWKPTKKRKQKAPLSERKLERKRAKLGDGEWHEGELVSSEPAPIVAAWRFDLPRTEARSIAEELGLSEFYWACAGSTIETHPADMFSSEDAFELKQLRVRSREGLKDMLRAAFDLAHLVDSARAASSTLGRLQLISALVLIVSLVVTALSISDWFWLSGQSAPQIAGVLVHPILIPAALLGAYSRLKLWPHQASKGNSRLRELDREEAAKKWQAISAHELAVWLLLGSSVALLTLGGQVSADEFSAAHYIKDTTRGFLIALWLLPPLAYSRDLSAAFGACIQAAITIVVALIVIKLALLFSGTAAGFLWSIVTGLIPFEFPDWIRVSFEVATSILAELVVAMLFLGYTWSRARNQFANRATIQVSPSN